MGRRPQPPKEHRPSPLQQVELTRPISVLPPSQVVPELGLVRDPAFWKRFSVAVHKAEETDSEMGLKTPASSVDIKYGDQWLQQQHRDKRRCRAMGAFIALAVVVVIAAAVIVGMHFINMPH